LTGLGESGGSPGAGASARDCGGGCTGAAGGNGHIEITYSGSNGSAYTYAGTGYANPHAPTTINGVNLTYDNNGNVTAYGTSTYAYNYRNRMTQSVVNNATSTYLYDHMDQRVKMAVGSTTTIYPSKFVNVVLGTTTTNYIYLGDTIVAEVEVGSSTTSSGGGSASTSTPAFVQSKKDASSGVVTFTNAVTTGNLVVVGLTIWNTTIPSNAITDNKGNTYTKVAEAIQPGTTDHAALFYAKNVTGGSSFTVTSSVGGTISVHEYSGISTTSPFDKAASSTGTSATVSSGTVTTTLASELYVGVMWSEGSASSTAGGGYTLREQEINNVANERQATEDQVISVATTTKALWSIASNDWAAAIASFRAATTSGSGVMNNKKAML
jgi:hypothetical protein